MQDSQDNTFPIPQSDNTQNQIGGSVPQSSDNQVNPSVMPGTSIDPVDTSQPPQPDWQTVAAQDTATLNPVQSTPDQNPMPTANPALDVSQVGQEASMPQSPVDSQGLSQQPVSPSTQPTYDTQPAQPLAPVESAPQNTMQTPMPQQVPSSNMLDLTNAQQSQPAVPVPPPSPYNQQGAMQPGVDVSPTPNVAGSVPPGFGGDLGIGDMGAPVPPPPNNKKKFIIIGAVAVGFIIILSLVLLMLTSSKKSPAVELNQEQVEQTQQASESTSTEPASIPEGYKKIDRDCFSFGAFVPNTINLALPQCKVAAKFGSVSQYDITITPVTNSVTDLQALVDQAKVGTISTQTDIKLNNVAAKQVIQKVNGLDQQTIVVIPDNKNYQIDGQSINGFIINTSYNDDTAKKASETLVSTWTWK